MKINETRNARALALAFTIGVGLVCHTTAAQAQSAMAPPVSAGAPASSSNVYQWADVPLNQQIPITRAVFDQGGYQLYASTGETIVVPFVNQNLYVMKFGQTSGGMYFVNDGSAPTLFVPPGGYLENAAASGAHWYPFPHDFHYVSPVYVGIAPTWDAYVGMGWYPGMAYYGGYWGYHPWHVGIAFSPFPGLYFSIGGHPYYGWNSYHSYYFGHPYGRVYERSYASYHYYGVPHRGPSYFAGRAAFGHPSGYYASHGSFAHGGGAFGRAGAVHGGAFGHAAVSHGGAFGHATVAHGGSFGRTAGAGHAFGGAVSHGGGSFGHSGGAFGGGHSGGGSFGRSASGGGHPAAFGGGGSHGSFGGGGGASHGSFGGGGGASHGSFGGGGSHGGGGGGDHHK